MSKHPDARALTTVDTQKERMNAFRVGGQFINPKSPRFREIDDPATSRAAWEENISAANRHNDPGRLALLAAEPGKVRLIKRIPGRLLAGWPVPVSTTSAREHAALSTGQGALVPVPGYVVGAGQVSPGIRRQGVRRLPEVRSS